MTIDAFDLEVDGLVFDRVSAFNGDVQVTDLDQATTSISLSEATISDLVGRARSTSPPTAPSPPAGSPCRPSWRAASLVLTGDGIDRVVGPVRLDRFLPCDPEVAVGRRRWSR